MRRLTLLFTILAVVAAKPVLAIVPAKPGVAVPQIVIDRAQQEGDRFYPRPALANTMARYAAAKRRAALLGLDDVDDIYAHAPVVCGKYSDSGPDDWPIGDMQDQLFDGPWPTLTMKEFYEEISYDQFHLDGTVYGWYTSTLTQAYVVGNNYGFGPDAHVGEFLFELLNFCDPTTDFGQYDNDGPDNVPNSGDDDGFVDTIFFIHDGAGGETGAQNIWSHSYSLYYLMGTYFYTDDPSANGGYIKIGSYIIQPSINSEGQIIEIGVFCHEYGHALGLPDLYDGDYSSSGIGVWGLMGSGSWNTPASPSHMIAWCRYKLGWIDPTEVITWLHDQPITAIETSGQAFKLWTGGIYGTQYFMVENRQRYGADVHLMGEGLLIWHIDETAQQTNENHPKVDLEEADGQDDLYYGANSGDSGDIYPGYSDNHWFDEYTYPNSLDYFGNLTQVAVWDISDEADTMYANLDVVYSQPRLEYQSAEINDASGNNDGRADPGETIGLWITLENLWADAVNLTGTLSTQYPYADITDSTAQFGNIASHGTGSNQASPFQVNIHPDAPDGSWLPLDVNLTADGGFAQDISFSILIGRAPVLLVDDDLGENYEQYYISSLQELDALYEVWDVSQIGVPGQDVMLYDAILWITGDDSLTTLTGNDMADLQQYIDGGGTLILTGQNINEDIGGTTFFTDYLQCTPRTNQLVAQYTLNGVPGNPVSENMSLLLIGAGGAGNQTSPSSVYPQGTAQSLFTYPNGEVGGINYDNPTNGAHVVYLAFGLEAVSGLAATSTRAEVLAAIFDWAQIVGVEQPAAVQPIPGAYNLKQNHPNPFNPTTTIHFDLPKAGGVKLEVFDVSGRIVGARHASPLPLVNGWREAGSHEVMFDGSDLPSGIYFARLTAGDFVGVQKMVLLK